MGRSDAFEKAILFLVYALAISQAPTISKAIGRASARRVDGHEMRKNSRNRFHEARTWRVVGVL